MKKVKIYHDLLICRPDGNYMRVEPSTIRQTLEYVPLEEIEKIQKENQSLKEALELAIEALKRIGNSIKTKPRSPSLKRKMNY